MADRIVAGRVRSPYGVRGWVWMDSFTDNPVDIRVDALDIDARS